MEEDICVSSAVVVDFEIDAYFVVCMVIVVEGSIIVRTLVVSAGSSDGRGVGVPEGLDTEAAAPMI